MTQFKGTPKPWKVCGANGGKCKCGLIWSTVADFTVAKAIRHDDELGDISEEQFNANKNLIAAAPDLLEALENLVKIIETGGNYSSAIKSAKSAINKALNQEA